MSDREIVEANAAMMRREIMGRLATVREELDLIDGSMDDLPPPRDARIDSLVTAVQGAASALADVLIREGWR